MNNVILDHIILNEYKSMEINTFQKSFAGTQNIAKDYLNQLPNCSYIQHEKSLIEIFYKNKSIGFLRGQTPSTNLKSGIKITNNKLSTENYLTEADIPTTQSKIFKKHEKGDAQRYITSLEVPVVVKPNNLNAGKGITLDVTLENFDYAWNYAVQACTEKNKPVQILIQKFIEGIESRFLVIENKFESAILRLPTHVIGNGTNTVSELIEKKNKERELNPHLKLLKIKYDSHMKYVLEIEKLNINSIPVNNRIVYLRDTSNISMGGDSFEISHLINDDMKSLAEKAIRAIPGVSTGGVDMIYSSFDDNLPTVLEINTGANLKMHYYPFKGTPKEPIKTLIDAMIEKSK